MGKSVSAKEAARLLGRSPSTLQKMRRDQLGPEFRREGRCILYDIDKIREYKRMVRTWEKRDGAGKRHLA